MGFARRPALVAVITTIAAALAAAPVVGAQRAAKNVTPKLSATSGAVARDGRQLFATTCAACHQVNGEGVPDRYPPLAGSEWVAGDEERLLRIVLRGLTGEVEVQGEMFTGEMPAWGPQLKDADIAAVVSYVREKFGNGAPPIVAASVARVRKTTAKRTKPYTAIEVSRPSVAPL